MQGFMVNAQRPPQVVVQRSPAADSSASRGSGAGGRGGKKRLRPLWLLRLPITIRSLARRWPITVTYFALVGFTLAVGIVLVKALADATEATKEQELQSRLNSLTADGISFQVGATSLLYSLTNAVVANPASPDLIGADFSRTVNSGVTSFMRGLGGRAAGIWSRQGKGTFQDLFGTFLKIPLIAHVWLAPGGQVQALWNNPYNWNATAAHKLFYPSQRLYEDLVWQVFFEEEFEAPTVLAIPPTKVEAGNHLWTMVFPIWIPASNPDTIFGSYPEYPNCQLVSKCYNNATREKFFGLAGVTIQMDLVLDTLPLMVQLKEDGYKIASYMQPTDILLSKTKLKGAPFEDRPMEHLGSLEEVLKGKKTFHTVSTVSKLWTYNSVMKSPVSLHVKWRGPLYGAVAVIALVLGIVYLRMSLSREEYFGLLRSILPQSAVTALLRDERFIRTYENVTIMSMCIAEYKGLPAAISEEDIVLTLYEVFHMIDRLIERYGGAVMKLDQHGDALIACSNPERGFDPSVAAGLLTSFALDVLAASREFTCSNKCSIVIRVGLHSGKTIGAVLGTIKPSFTMLSSTVNMATLLQCAAYPSSAFVSPETAMLLQATRTFNLTARQVLLPGEAESRQVFHVSRARLQPVVNASAKAGAASLAKMMSLQPSSADHASASSIWASLPFLPPIKTQPTSYEDLVQKQVLPEYPDIETYSQMSARNVLARGDSEEGGPSPPLQVA